MFETFLLKRDKKKLMISFSDMIVVRKGGFVCFKTFDNIFFDHDILFVKDTELNKWYLEDIDNIEKDIREYSCEYDEVYGITSSSGTIPLLNILHNLSNFKKAVIINGQCCLTNEIVDLYRHCVDCVIFNENLVKSFNKAHLDPMKFVSRENQNKFHFFYNDSISDNIYANHLKNFNVNLNQELSGESHGDYIIRKLTDKKFLSELQTLLS